MKTENDEKSLHCCVRDVILDVRGQHYDAHENRLVDCLEMSSDIAEALIRADPYLKMKLVILLQESCK